MEVHQLLQFFSSLLCRSFSFCSTYLELASISVTHRSKKLHSQHLQMLSNCFPQMACSCIPNICYSQGLTSTKNEHLSMISQHLLLCLPHLLWKTLIPKPLSPPHVMQDYFLLPHQANNLKSY